MQHVLLLLASFLMTVFTAQAQTLPAYHAEEIQKDGGIQDFTWYNQDTIFMITNSTLWRWNLTQNSLKKLALPHHDLRNIKSQNDMAYIVSLHGLITLNWDTLQVSFKKLPTWKELKLFTIFEQSIYLVLDNLFIEKDLSAGDIKFRKIPYLNPKDFISTDHDTFYFARNNQILSSPLSNSMSAPKAIFRSKHDLRGVFSTKNNLLTFTDHTVLILDKKGKLLRSIPVEGEHALINLEIRDESHSYLFDDGLLNIFIPHEKQSITTKLDTPQIEIVKVTNGKFAYTQNGLIKVVYFNHE